MHHGLMHEKVTDDGATPLPTFKASLPRLSALMKQLRAVHSSRETVKNFFKNSLNVLEEALFLMISRLDHWPPLNSTVCPFDPMTSLVTLTTWLFVFGPKLAQKITQSWLTSKALLFAGHMIKTLESARVNLVYILKVLTEKGGFHYGQRST